MRSLYFGGGVAQDSESREAVSPTHYFHMINKATKEDLSLTRRVFFVKYTRKGEITKKYSGVW